MQNSVLTLLISRTASIIFKINYKLIMGNKSSITIKQQQAQANLNTASNQSSNLKTFKQLIQTEFLSQALSIVPLETWIKCLEETLWMQGNRDIYSKEVREILNLSVLEIIFLDSKWEILKLEILLIMLITLNSKHLINKMLRKKVNRAI